jgi:hypothetical protein
MSREREASGVIAQDVGDLRAGGLASRPMALAWRKGLLGRAFLPVDPVERALVSLT